MKQIIFIIVVTIFLSACKKFLDKRSDARLNIPSTIDDLQALLDNSNTINKAAPSAGETASDDYFLTVEDYNSREEYIRNQYTWEKTNLFKPSSSNDWNNPYKVIYNANLVLDNIDNVKRNSGDQEEYNNTKGCALFLRGYNFQLLASIFTKVYNPATSVIDAGLPLRLNSDFNARSQRSSLKETYDQIVSDLREAAAFLPIQSLHKVRPSKTAAYGLLARTFLYMGSYDSALLYSNKCLTLNDTLMDYNSLNANASTPFQIYGSEVLFHNVFNPVTIKSPQIKIDTNLYTSYSNNDLRRQLYFKASGSYFTYKGGYEGSSGNFFGGIATDEIYLMRAECFARKGTVNEAMKDLNKLLQKRIKNTVPYINETASSLQEALQLIIKERRKELVFRGLRWMDIKRYNKDEANIILKRTINGKEYILLPNSLRYAFPIPDEVIALSGMQQNP